jgi:hypothetical protein
MPMTKEDRSARHYEVGVGREIDAFLSNEIIKKTITGILNGIQNEWLVQPRADARELLWQQAQGVQKFVATLKELVDTGKLASEQLKLDNQQRGENGQEST